MGAGKSAVGRHLARTGVDIPFIFEKEGEEGFRKREATAIDDLSQRENIVLATGGGAVLLPENRNHLAGRGFVVYLYTTVEQQVSRTAKGRTRPLLETGDPRSVLEDLLKIRDPLYREVADLVVETDGRKVKSVADEIIENLG